MRRRFLIWSALLVIVALAVAGGGYWAYWNFYARFQPVTVAENQDEIQRLLDEAPWVSNGGGDRPVYVIGYRDSASTQRYQREELDKLRAGGAEARLIVFARPDAEGGPQSTPAERATVAELWLTRDWTLAERWWAASTSGWTAAGIAAADGDLARTAVVNAGRQFVARLSELTQDAGAPAGYPLVIWRDQDGFLKVCACADARSWAFVRDAFDAPDAAAPSGVEGSGPVAPPMQPSGSGVQSLPYPNLATPATPGQPPANASGVTTPGMTAAPPATAPSTQRQPAAPPQPAQQDDSTFY